MFTNGPGDRDSIPCGVLPKTQKWYLMLPCLTLSIIRCISRVKWSNPQKGVAHSPKPRCSSYRKRDPSSCNLLRPPTFTVYISIIYSFIFPFSRFFQVFFLSFFLSFLIFTFFFISCFRDLNFHSSLIFGFSTLLSSTHSFSHFLFLFSHIFIFIFYSLFSLFCSLSFLVFFFFRLSSSFTIRNIFPLKLSSEFARFTSKCLDFFTYKLFGLLIQKGHKK